MTFQTKSKTIIVLIISEIAKYNFMNERHLHNKQRRKQYVNIKIWIISYSSEVYLWLIIIKNYALVKRDWLVIFMYISDNLSIPFFKKKQSQFNGT